MKSIREIVALVLVFACLFSLPVGIIFLCLGLSGQLADAEYELNVRAGITLFLLSLIPPIALSIWIWVWRGKWLPF